jgi:Cu-Zn family superoxide dismutase
MRVALLAAAAFVLAPAASRAAESHAARALLKDAKGQQVGMATFVDTGNGVTLTVKVKGLPPGTHGIHLHAVGKCDDPEFKSAGAHFNPTGKKHGVKSPEGHHAGDLPNLVVDTNGQGELKTTVEGVTLGTDAWSLFGPQGTALVVHAAPDDDVTDPSGNSGARIACGVVSHGKE